MTADYVPLPGVSGQPDLRNRKRRRHRRPWYRRPVFVTLALLAAVLIIGAAGAAYYIQQQFEQINDLSTPPPVVSGSVFDDEGGSDVQVDTSPAQRALELAASGQTGDFSLADDAAGPPAPATRTHTGWHGRHAAWRRHWRARGSRPCRHASRDPIGLDARR